MSRSTLRTSPLVVEAVAFFAFAAPIGMLGAAWPEGRLRVDRPAAALALVVTGYGIGRMSTSASAVAILRRVAIGRATAAACVVLAIAQVGVALTRSYALLVVAATAVGLVSGCLDSLGNRYQTAVRDVRQAGLMFGAYGLGATTFPALVALTSWPVGFLVSAGVGAAAAAVALSPAVIWPDGIDERRPTNPDIAEATGPEVQPAQAVIDAAPSDIAEDIRSEVRPANDEGAAAGQASAVLGPLPRAAVLTSLAAFGLVCILEIVTGNWAATYLEDGRGASGRSAALALSGFWGGLTLGRLVLGRLPGGPRRILVVSGLSAAALIAVVPLLPVPVALATYAVIGLTLAPILPTLMSTTADRVGTAWAGRVGGWQLLAANICGTALGVVIGAITESQGAEAIGVTASVIALAGIPVTLAVSRLVHR